jgi:hypothetical protein
MSYLKTHVRTKGVPCFLNLSVTCREAAMIQIAIEMPVVAECSIGECAYNANNACHARAITVGDSAVHPGCDTFLGAAPRSRASRTTAGVGACKATSCRYNDDYECVTDKISVGHASNSICCLTYQRR